MATVSSSIPTPQNAADESAPSRLRSTLHITWSRFLRSKTALVGLILICCLLATALLADVLAPYSPYAVDSDASLSPPSPAHPLGTDLLGRDMLSRIIHGSRVSLYVGFTSISLAIFVGIPLGLIAGFYGGKFDRDL